MTAASRIAATNAIQNRSREGSSDAPACHTKAFEETPRLLARSIRLYAPRSTWDALASSKVGARIRPASSAPAGRFVTASGACQPGAKTTAAATSRANLASIVSFPNSPVTIPARNRLLAMSGMKLTPKRSERSRCCPYAALDLRQLPLQDLPIGRALNRGPHRRRDR